MSVSSCWSMILFRSSTFFLFINFHPTSEKGILELVYIVDLCCSFQFSASVSCTLRCCYSIYKQDSWWDNLVSLKEFIPNNMLHGKFFSVFPSLNISAFPIRWINLKIIIIFKVLFWFPILPCHLVFFLLACVSTFTES